MSGGSEDYFPQGPDRSFVNGIFRGIKHTAATLVSLGVIFAFFGALVTAFGGKVPPWLVEKEVQLMIDRAVDKIHAENDAKECADYNARFLRAQQVLRQTPNDAMALVQYTDFNNAIDMIHNCKKATLP